jgi:(p)ppGpp synthase/HD superfamily hydrolase
MNKIIENINIINKGPRHIDILYNYIKEKLFWNSELSENEIRELMEPINSIYTSVKMKTFWIYRENNERVLLHYRETAYIITDNFDHLNLNKIKISLLHDLIEDTNIKF